MNQEFQKIQMVNGKGEEIYYFLYQPSTTIERVVVYLHGLISDISWFRLPEKLSPATSVLFFPRWPRQHVDDYKDWYSNQKQMLDHYKKTHQAKYYHLLANCFGSHSALYWTTVNPETFHSLTITNPPMALKRPFGAIENLKVLRGSFTDKKRLRKCTLETKDFYRIVGPKKNIENNPNVEFSFSEAFYGQIFLLKKWLKQNLKTHTVPTHIIYCSEDEVINFNKSHQALSKIRYPEKVTYMYSDHYLEHLPSKSKFWQSVFDFQQNNEPCYAYSDKYESVLVTGATGFLGIQIVKKLIQNNKKVIALVRDLEIAQKIFKDIGEKLIFKKGDVLEMYSLEAAMENVDVVIHTAGYVNDWAPYQEFKKVNVDGTKNCLMAAHFCGVKQFIHVSSLGVFGDTDQYKLDENNAYQLSSDFYSNSKIEAEIFLKKYCQQNEYPFTIIRPGFIYGEGDNHFFPKLIENLKNEKVKFIGSGQTVLNTVYVGNVVALIESCIGNPQALGESFNIADFDQVTVKKFFTDVARGLGLKIPEKKAPKNIALGLGSVMENTYKLLKLAKAPPLTRKKITFLARHRSINSKKAYDLIGRIPFDYHRGMKLNLDWLKQQ